MANFDIVVNAIDKATNVLGSIGKAGDTAGRNLESAGSKASSAMGKIEGSSGKASGALAGVVKNAAGFALGFAAVGSVPDILGSISSGAVTLQQNMDKANIVFGESMGTVQKWATSSAANMGLTQRGAVSLAAGMADLLKPMGFTGDQAAQMSTQVLDLSGALAEWSNGQYDAAGVADLLQSAMLGETDGLKALGISLSADEIARRAATLTGEEYTNMTDAQKNAIATQQLIMEKSTDAQKSYANSMDDAASKQARSTAKINEAKEALILQLAPAVAAGITAFGALATILATVVVPALSTVISYVIQLVSFFSDHLAVVLPVIVPLLAGFGAAILASIIPAMAAWTVETLANVAAHVAAAAAWLAAYAPIIVTIGLVAAAVYGLYYAWTNNLFGIRDIANQVWGYVGPFISGAINGIKAVFDAVLPALSVIVQTVFGAIQTIIQTIVGGIKLYIETYIALWKAVFDTLLPPIQAVVETVFGAIKTVIETIIGWAKGFFDAEVAGWKAIFDRVLPPIQSLVETVFGAIKATIETIIGAVQSAIESTLGAIQGTWDTTWSAVSTTVSGTWDAIKSTVSGAVDQVKGFVGGLKDDVVGKVESLRSEATEKFDSLKSDVVTKAQGLKDDVITAVQEMYAKVIEWAGNLKTDVVTRVTEMVSDAVSEIGGLGEKALSAIGDVSRLLYSKGTDLVQGLIDGVSDKIQALKDKIGEIGDVLGSIDVPGFSPPGEAGWEIGTEYSSRMAAGIASGLGAVQRATGQLGAAMGNAPLKNEITDAGINPAFGAGINDFIQATLDDMGGFTRENYNEAWRKAMDQVVHAPTGGLGLDVVDTGAFHNYVEALAESGDALNDYITSIPAEFRDKVEAWGKKYGSTIQSFANKNAGSGLIRGLINGMTGMLPKLQGTVSQIGQTLGAIDVPGYSPPDDAGEEIGNGYGEGIFDGLNRWIPTIDEAIARVGDALGTIPQMPIMPGAGTEPDVPQYLTGNGNYGTVSGGTGGGTHGPRTGPAKGGGYWYNGVLYRDAAAAHAANNIGFDAGGANNPNTSGKPTTVLNTFNITGVQPGDVQQEVERAFRRTLQDWNVR